MGRNQSTIIKILARIVRPASEVVEARHSEALPVLMLGPRPAGHSDHSLRRVWLAGNEPTRDFARFCKSFTKPERSSQTMKLVVYLKSGRF